MIKSDKYALYHPEDLSPASVLYSLAGRFYAQTQPRNTPMPGLIAFTLMEKHTITLLDK